MPRPRPDKRRRLLLRWGGISVAATAAVVVLVAALTRPKPDAVPAAGASVEGLTSVLEQSAKQHEVPLRFRDVTKDVGLEFQHMPMPRASLLPEDMGSGVAAGDYDNDGYIDLYFVNLSGNALPDAPLDQNATSMLFRNVSGERFEDMTQQAGVGFVGYGMGAAWGDYDNDGDLDLYVTAFGPNVLYENQGDGTFIDATETTGVQDARFSAGASWGDFDRDGHIDLYVCNYVDFVYREEDRSSVQSPHSTGQPYTLNPSSYPPLGNSLFHNRGDGTFEEIAATVGVNDAEGKSMSASWVDLNNDGWVDLYVANDVSKNAVYLNKCADGTIQFEDIGAASLAADYRGAMGIAVADFDADLDQDMFITHWIAQENAVYRNMLHDRVMGTKKGAKLWFLDDAESCGLGQISLDLVGWAAGFCDFDNDGRLDLWSVNGSTMEERENKRLLKGQPTSLYWHRGERGYVDVAKIAAPPIAAPAVRRAAAHLNFDNDGLIDLVVCEHGGLAALLKNVSPKPGHWLRVGLSQTHGNTRALGARVYVVSNGRTQMSEIGASSSYLSQDETTCHFGLANAERVDEVRIVWPDGHEETHRDLAVNKEHRFKHAAGYK